MGNPRFQWAIFNSKLLVITRGYSILGQSYLVGHGSWMKWSISSFLDGFSPDCPPYGYPNEVHHPKPPLWVIIFSNEKHKTGYEPFLGKPISYYWSMFTGIPMIGWSNPLNFPEQKLTVSKIYYVRSLVPYAWWFNPPNHWLDPVFVLPY